MNKGSFDVPVGLVIFNRPEHTAWVLAEIARIRPRKLMVAADGPRPTHPKDAALCQAARAVIGGVAWDCEVRTQYSEKNLGAGVRVATACDWFFAQEEEVIVLEDDCVPDISFFRFCAELLRRYRDDPRVFVIGGDNFQFGRNRTAHSYYFSRYPQTWGWAAWRRTWRLYDFQMTRWPELRRTDWLDRILENRQAVRCWRRIFEQTYQRRIDTFDYQLVLAIWLAGGLCVVPEVNLVRNVGHGDQASHTFNRDSPLSNVPAVPIHFPLRHPPNVERHASADDWDQETVFAGPAVVTRVRQKIRRLVARWMA